MPENLSQAIRKHQLGLCDKLELCTTERDRLKALNAEFKIALQQIRNEGPKDGRWAIADHALAMARKEG